MRQAILFGLLLTFAGNGSATADQSEELRQRALVIKTEAIRLAEAGQRAEAARLATIADDLMSMADRTEPEPFRGNPTAPARVLFALNSTLRDRQKSLNDYERRMRNPNGDPVVRKIRNDISEIKREISRVEVENQNSGKIEEAAARVLHLRAAADHLQKAGMLDLAGQALMKAAILDQEVVELQRKLNTRDQTPPAPMDPAKSAENEELRKENEKMRAELEALRKVVKAK